MNKINCDVTKFTASMFREIRSLYFRKHQRGSLRLHIYSSDPKPVFVENIDLDDAVGMLISPGDVFSFDVYLPDSPRCSKEHYGLRDVFHARFDGSAWVKISDKAASNYTERTK